MAAAGGDEPRRPPGPAHLYGSYKKLLLGIFDDMDNPEYRSFKHYLDCVVTSDNVSIPKARIMRTRRLDMPDLILRYIPRREALEVVARILQDLPNVQLLERIQQFTHPEPGTLGYMVMQIKHAAESEENYLRTCQNIAATLNRCSPGLGNLILDEIMQQECVLAKYLLSVEELALKRPADIIQKMASEGRKEELRHLGVIYITVEDATLFTGELHNDPRTWDHVEVTQWVAETLLPRDQTATIPDLQLTGAEICAKPETWFTDKFPVGMGRVLYTDLQERRDDIAHQRKFGGRQEELERVVEKTSATFLVSAYLMSMILTLLGQHREKAEDILEYLRSLIQVTERQSKKTFHSGDFNYSWASKNIIKERSSLPSSAASVVFGSTAIAISREAYSQVVTSVVEAMEVIGAPLEVKIKSPWLGWRHAITIGVCFAVGLEAGLIAGLGAVLVVVLTVALREVLRAGLRCLGADLGVVLRADLGAGLVAVLGAGLIAVLRVDLEADLRANLGVGLFMALIVSLIVVLGAELGAVLRADLRAGLRAGLRAVLVAVLGAELEGVLGADLKMVFGWTLTVVLIVVLGGGLETVPVAGLGGVLGVVLGAGLGGVLRAVLGTGLIASLVQVLRVVLGVGLVAGLVAVLRVGLGVVLRMGLVAGLIAVIVVGLVAVLRAVLVAGIVVGLLAGREVLVAVLMAVLVAGLRADLGVVLGAVLAALLIVVLRAGVGAVTAGATGTTAGFVDLSEGLTLSRRHLPELLHCLHIALNALYESEKKTAFYKVNYLQALILLPKVLLESKMEGYKLENIIEHVQDESKRCSTQEAERKMMELLPHVSQFRPRMSPIRTQKVAPFHYRAMEWLHDDSIHNINDNMIIAHAHFDLRRLLRKVFVLGVLGSAHSGKTTLIKSVLPRGEQSAHHTTTGPYDVKLYNGSNELGEDTLPVLDFSSGQGKEVDADHSLCVGICTAFICVVECKTVFPDIRALARVAHLSVPVLLCVNKCGGVKNQRQASQVLDRYESAVSREFEGLSSLTEVVLTDFHTTGYDQLAWLTGAEGVKYWIKDAIQNHKRYVRNTEAELQVSERELSF